VWLVAIPIQNRTPSTTLLENLREKSLKQCVFQDKSLEFAAEQRNATTDLPCQYFSQKESVLNHRDNFAVIAPSKQRAL
jgi:hypothetical protein